MNAMYAMFRIIGVLCLTMLQWSGSNGVTLPCNVMDQDDTLESAFPWIAGLFNNVYPFFTEVYPKAENSFCETQVSQSTSSYSNPSSSTHQETLWETPTSPSTSRESHPTSLLQSNPVTRTLTTTVTTLNALEVTSEDSSFPTAISMTNERVRPTISKPRHSWLQRLRRDLKEHIGEMTGPLRRQKWSEKERIKDPHWFKDLSETRSMLDSPDRPFQRSFVPRFHTFLSPLLLSVYENALSVTKAPPYEPSLAHLLAGCTLNAVLPECGICMDAKADRELQPCGHAICSECDRAIVELHGSSASCPFCRRGRMGALKTKRIGDPYPMANTWTALKRGIEGTEDDGRRFEERYRWTHVRPLPSWMQDVTQRVVFPSAVNPRSDTTFADLHHVLTLEEIMKALNACLIRMLDTIHYAPADPVYQRRKFYRLNTHSEAYLRLVLRGGTKLWLEIASTRGKRVDVSKPRIHHRITSWAKHVRSWRRTLRNVVELLGQLYSNLPKNDRCMTATEMGRSLIENEASWRSELGELDMLLRDLDAYLFLYLFATNQFEKPRMAKCKVKDPDPST